MNSSRTTTRTPGLSSGPRQQIPSSLKSSDYVNVFPGQDTSMDLHKSRPFLCSPHPDSSQLNQLRFKTVYTLAASRCGSLGEIRNVSSRLPSCAYILLGRQRFRPRSRPELIAEIADAVGGGCSRRGATHHPTSMRLPQLTLI